MPFRSQNSLEKAGKCWLGYEVKKLFLALYDFIKKKLSLQPEKGSFRAYVIISQPYRFFQILNSKQ